MENLLKSITVVFRHVFGEWFPAFLQMGTGTIGAFLDTIGHAKAIILAIAALLVAAIRWIRSRLKR